MAGRGTAHLAWSGWLAAVVAAMLAVPLAPAAPATAASSGGAVYVWGIGFSGQMGNGPFGAAVPIPLQDVEGIVFTDIDIGGAYDLALTHDGRIYGWGQNAAGQLGRGFTSSVERTPMPVEVPEGVQFTAVAAGAQHALALAGDGTAHAWGGNTSGQLGDGTTEDRSAPEPVSTPAGASFVDVAGGDSFSLAVDSDGIVYAWGANSAGELGNGATGGFDPTPTPIDMPDGVRFIAVSAGTHFAMALADDGTVYAWGNNSFGELGNGTTGGANPSAESIAMPADTTFVAIDGGTFMGSALTPGGELYVWGRNVNRRFGTGNSDSSNSPVQTVPPDGGTFGAMAIGVGTQASGGVTGLPTHAIAAYHGDGQVVHAHESFRDPLRAAVTTVTGDPVPGVPVTFTIHSPATFDDGEATAIALTAADGLATSPPLTATGETGSVEVTATVPGIAQAATFTLTVLPEPPEPPPPELPEEPPPGEPPAEPRPGPPWEPSPGPSPTAVSGAPGAAGNGALPDSGSRVGWLLALGALLTPTGVLLLTLGTRTRRSRRP